MRRGYETVCLDLTKPHACKRRQNRQEQSESNYLSGSFVEYLNISWNESVASSKKCARTRRTPLGGGVGGTIGVSILVTCSVV